MPPSDWSSLESFAAIYKQRSDLRRSLLGPPPPTIKQSEITYPSRDGTQLRALLFQPAKPPRHGSPLAVIIHGGGWCVGFPENEDQTCRNLVEAFGATCVSVSYRLAPQWKFPTAHNDTWDALRWAAKNAASWGADPSVGFIVGGSSAGGNMAAVLAHKARDENLSPPLTGQWLAIPGICPPGELPEKYSKYDFSYAQNKDAPVLPVAAIEMFMNGYEPDPHDSENYAILNHPKGHKGLPKAFFQIDGLDPLRDEALIYERVLREEAGVETRMDVYPGLPHGHWSFFPQLSSSTKFRVDQVHGFGWLLGKEPDMTGVRSQAVASAT